MAHMAVSTCTRVHHTCVLSIQLLFIDLDLISATVLAAIHSGGLERYHFDRRLDDRSDDSNRGSRIGSPDTT